MKIAVVTPTTGGDAEELQRCNESVTAAYVPLLKMPAVHELVHVIVWDGATRLDAAAQLEAHVIELPNRAHDAGATPRAIGAAYAVGQGCDAMFFVDADNRFTPEHITNAIQLAEQGAQVVTSRRWMVSAVTGERMYVDETDSDGIAFADTNTVALFGRAVQFGTTWNWFRQPSGTDRTMWDRLRHSFLGKIACTGQPTVEYVTRWANHYNVPAQNVIGYYPQWQAPNPAKFAALDQHGVRYALIAEPVWERDHWEPKADPERFTVETAEGVSDV